MALLWKIICNLGDPMGLRHPVRQNPLDAFCFFILNSNFQIPTHMLSSHNSCHGMGWLRLVGSLKLYVSFAKEPHKSDDILQKRPIIVRSLLIVATPSSDVWHDVLPCAECVKIDWKTQIFLFFVQPICRVCQKWMHDTHLHESRHMNESFHMNASRPMNAERWGAGVEYHFQKFNEPYARS